MADVVKTSLADLRDPDKYICKKGVPWFRPHKRKLLNEKTGEWEEFEVTEADLPEIAENMQALESEGRAFRITNGHIDKLAKEKDQPELLGMALNPRLGKFGPKGIPAVLVDEYIRYDKAATVGERPYRSAEFYRQKKLITGAAALVRDPQLNLGVVLYSEDDPVIIYGEAVPEMSSNDNDLSPEEVELFERFMKYMQRQQQSAQQPTQNAAGAMGPMNAAQPQPVGYQESDDMPQVIKPEDAVNYSERIESAEKRAEAAEKRLAEIENDRKREKSERLLDRLGEVEHFEFDRKEELELMMNTDDAGREKIAARIRKFHGKVPGHEDEVPVDYSNDNRQLPERKKETPNPLSEEPVNYQEVMDFVRSNPGVTYEEAEAKVKAKK